MSLNSSSVSFGKPTMISVDKDKSEVLISVMLFGRPQSIKAKFSEIEKKDNQK